MEAWRDRAFKANWLSVKWHGYFFKARASYRRRGVRYPLFTKMRGANFACCWIGPIYICWRMPWIESVARINNPEWFNDAKQEQA